MAGVFADKVTASGSGWSDCARRHIVETDHTKPNKSPVFFSTQHFGCKFVDLKGPVCNIWRFGDRRRSRDGVPQGSGLGPLPLNTDIDKLKYKVKYYCSEFAPTLHYNYICFQSCLYNNAKTPLESFLIRTCIQLPFNTYVARTAFLTPPTNNCLTTHNRCVAPTGC